MTSATAITSFRQKTIEPPAQNNDVVDVEDIVAGKRQRPTTSPPVINKKRKVDKKVGDSEFLESDLLKSWKEVLGNPPSMGTTRVSSMKFSFQLAKTHSKAKKM